MTKQIFFITGLFLAGALIWISYLMYRNQQLLSDIKSLE